jgi:hypothetical protein
MTGFGGSHGELHQPAVPSGVGVSMPSSSGWISELAGAWLYESVPWCFYALEVGLGLVRRTLEGRAVQALRCQGFYALVVGLRLPRDANFRPTLTCGFAMAPS